MSEDIDISRLKSHFSVDLEWLSRHREDIVEPDLEIVDAHHHVWDMPGSRYLFDEVMNDFNSGHRIVSSVYAQCHSMYRTEGPTEMRPVGETEFVSGIAQRGAASAYCSTALCAGIVGSADLMLGAGIEPVLLAHMQAGGGRFRGIRPTVAWHESPQLRVLELQPNILMRKAAREAIGCMEKLNLSLDLWVFYTQLDEVVDICRAFPGLTVVVNHTAGIVDRGPYASKQKEMFAEWREKVHELARCPNVVLKLGGLAKRYGGLRRDTLAEPPSSDLLVDRWNDCIQLCIDAFSPHRCMFESNFPVDRGSCNYHVLWNAFKKITRGYTPAERQRLFSLTAAETYRLPARASR